NHTRDAIDLAAEKYRIERATASGGDPKFIIEIGNLSHGTYPGGTVIPSDGYYLIVDENASAMLRENADAIIARSRGFALTQDNVVYLGTGSIGVPIGSSHADKDIVDYVGYGSALQFEGTAPAPQPQETEGLSRKSTLCPSSDTNDNAADFVRGTVVLQNTHGLVKEKISPESTSIPHALAITEILPNPSGDETEEEYIELYNTLTESVSLEGWLLRDSSTASPYAFPAGVVIGAQEYLTLYRSTFAFAMNNTGDETVSLSWPDGTLVSSVSYKTASEGNSYNLSDDNSWRWSNYQTPGRKNIFNVPPEISRLTISKKAYKNIPVDFFVRVRDEDGDPLKIRWDFGDGQKSYKKETRHTYAHTGAYAGAVRIDDGIEKYTESFVVHVRPFPQYDVSFVRLLPNPVGVDREHEWIAIENKSKKDIDLSGWSIATGQNSKKIINHPITDRSVEAGEILILTHEDTLFTLPNTKAR
ncbi:MAG TPA: lamin tail domain-containing protein, partial [Patescibacteria group bacterium]|nr:lamin tail domain-containing protein [Patescibacteria group bacterium]